MDQSLPSFPPKEIAEDGGAVHRKNPLDDFDLVIQLRVVEDRQGGTTRTGFGVARAKDDSLDARMDDGSRAHRTRLNCNIERAPAQAVVPEPSRCAAQGENLRVRRWITQMDWPVVGARDNFPISDEESPHRNFVLFAAPHGLAQGAAHEELVRCFKV